jgi:hypothetical protein
MNRRRLGIIALTVLVITLGLITAAAQTHKNWSETKTPDDNTAMKLEQGYAGVKPGSGNNLPRVEELKDKPGTWVTWPGFLLMPDGTSRLFLQTTVPVAYSIDERDKKISLKLKDAKVHLRNNRNPLVTVHFNTPLNRAYLKKNRKSLDLVMELRQSVMPRISQTVDHDGYHYLFVDFPPGSYPSAANPNPLFREYGTARPEEETAEAAPEALPSEQ